MTSHIDFLEISTSSSDMEAAMQLLKDLINSSEQELIEVLVEEFYSSAA
jgi:hypothetical protein